MQRAGATPTQNATPFFSNTFGASPSAPSRSRPITRSGDRDAKSPGTRFSAHASPPLPPVPTVSVFERDKERPRVLTKERKSSFSRKPSFTRKRSNSSVSVSNGLVNRVVTDSATPPALPDFALSAAAKVSRDSEAIQSPASADSFSKMLSRTAPTPVNGYSAAPSVGSISGSAQATEAVIMHAHIQETANKRMSTLDYLRKAHEGRVYWFNTLLFTQNDLNRLPSFAAARIARRATNYLLLGLSLPAVIDFNSSTPLEYLRALNTLLTEFDAFQALHSDGGASTGGLTRARLPQMFRRVPGGKGRRTSGQASDIGLPMGASTTNLVGSSTSTDTYSIGGQSSVVGGGGAGGQEGAAVMSFGAAESELLPGEEYTFLLTPSLPFEPDFFETFATLCDVLIDAYTKLMMLLPTPKDCSAPVAELFTKADAKVRKIIVQGCVKEFEDSSRAGVRTEVASVGKVILGGLI